jgi:L-lactate utilization protein LutB
MLREEAYMSDQTEHERNAHLRELATKIREHLSDELDKCVAKVIETFSAEGKSEYFRRLEERRGKLN